MTHAQMFGSKGIYLVPSANRRKLDNHSCECYFLGVLPNRDGVKVSDAKSNKIVETWDSYFHNDFTITNSKPSESQTDTVSNSPWLYPESASNTPITNRPDHDDIGQDPAA